ncbi:hypothetical protein [Kitasatospora sp. NPDC097643]|uniref:hypothetical protein n=1 Tax=Kitasatospora sp. NPDC097643 TaxID=3157230 RepID=UPI00331E2093
MENWDLQEWRASLGVLDPRAAAPPGVELQRQWEDLALVQAAGDSGLPGVAAVLRARARADAVGWRRVTEGLWLLHD